MTSRMCADMHVEVVEVRIGKQPLTWIAICDMDDDYLQAVLDYGGHTWHLDIIRKEIDYRASLLHKKLDK